MTGVDIAVANAPCSYGAFEITVGVDPNVPPALTLLDEVSEAGYRGIDLGPLGYLGECGRAARASARPWTRACRRLLPNRVQRSDSASRRARELDLLLDVFDAAADEGPPARPTLADAGSESRLAQPGRAQDDRSLGWDDSGWARFADSMAQVLGRCRERDTNRRSTHTPPRTWKRRGRSNDCFPSPTLVYASTQGTCCSVAATLYRRSAIGVIGSITSISRTRSSM